MDVIMAAESIPPPGPGVCAACGRSLPPNAPGGLCPACLLGHGVKLVAATSARSETFMLPSPEDLALLFPDFEILACLGHGGMGAVYQARQPELDRVVAIKILPPEAADDPEFTERFRREAATLAHLDHPNIVKLFDYGQRESFAYFVMEFVDGSDLSRRIASGPVSPEDAFGVVSQICDALHHSHERGVVHRDIKPANILVSQDGHVKVADFGLARLLHPDASDLGLTRTRVALGTPRYMAPEQVTGSADIDHRVDIYALGVVLYELLTGVLPVGRFDPPSEKVPTLNPRIDELVLQTLNAEPSRRPATAAAVKAGLRDAIQRPAPNRRERLRALVLRILTASILAALLGGAVVLFLVARADKQAKDLVSQDHPARFDSLRPSGRLVAFSESKILPFPWVGQPAVAVALAAARAEFGLVLRADGTVRAWGDNRFGQTDLPSGLTEVIAIAVGQGNRSAHALALRADGTVVGWGDNTFAQARPPPELTNAIAIAAGEWHSLALTKSGRVIGWGTPHNGAASVPGDLPLARFIAAGADFSLVLLKNGHVVAWGKNDLGQCKVPKLSQTVVEIAAGAGHGLARLEDGQVVAWGDNRAGQCAVPADLPPAIAIFAGGEGSAALDQNGAIHAWGHVPKALVNFKGRVMQAAIGSDTWILIETDLPETSAK